MINKLKMPFYIGDLEMEETKEFNKARTEITDELLINKAQETLHKLCKTGGRSFTMTVPPRIDDTDMIFGELINRYKQAIQVQAKVKPATCEHNFQIARNDYFKSTGEIGTLGLPTYKQDIVYSMLYCTKCGETKEIITS